MRYTKDTCWLTASDVREQLSARNDAERYFCQITVTMATVPALKRIKVKYMVERSGSLSIEHPPERPINLFCIPNAGGTALMYAQWKALLHPSVRLHLVELAGRGRRFQDCLYSTMSEVVEDIYSRIEPNLEAGDFAFFGHSMGALICYELIGTIWSRRNLAPLHAFLSGRVPPNDQETKMLHLQSDTDLLAEVAKWGGLSPQQLADKPFIHMFLPVLRADLRVVETYHLPERNDHRLPCSLSILAGADDTLAEPRKMQRWTSFTTQACSFHVFPGGHFYITEQKEEVVHLIKSVVSPASPL